MPNKQLLQSAGDGTTIPAGYVGQRLTSSGTQTGSASGTVTVNLSTPITLTPGVWIVQASGQATVVAPTRVTCTITNSSNASISDSDGFRFDTTVSDQNNTNSGIKINTGLHYFRISEGSTFDVKTQTVALFPSAGGTVQLNIQAIRIA